jgi:hypothetical protein
MRVAIFSLVVFSVVLLAACGDDDPLLLNPNAAPPVEPETPSNNPTGNEPPANDPSPNNPPVDRDPSQLRSDLGTSMPNPYTPLVALDPFAGSSRNLENFPTSYIVSGGVSKDGIPALTSPKFVSPGQVGYMRADDFVLGVVINGEAKAYPHNIGWRHEIVNDRVGGHSVVVTFCPLTGTGLVFDAENDNGESLRLGVSGLLFNNNLIMYDRRDNSTLYPQMYFTGIDGPRKGETLKLLPVVETTWSAWQKLHPDTRVVAGASSSYQVYPYGNYRTDDNYLLFGLFPDITDNFNSFSTVFNTKDRVLGVRLAGESKAYPFDVMGSRQVIHDQVGGVDLAVVWDRGTRLAIPFAREVSDQILSFEVVESGGFPFHIRDVETNTVWNLNGLAIEGPLAGQRLTQVPAHNSFWFAWVTFWQETNVWQP